MEGSGGRVAGRRAAVATAFVVCLLAGGHPALAGHTPKPSPPPNGGCPPTYPGYPGYPDYPGYPGYPGYPDYPGYPGYPPYPQYPPYPPYPCPPASRPSITDRTDPRSRARAR